MNLETSGRNPIRMGLHNRNLVLEVIRTHEPVPRPEIARLTGLTTAAITNIVKNLIKHGFIEEVGLGQSIGGRKPGLLQLARSSRFAIAVDLAATDLMVALTNVKGEILRRAKREIVVESSAMIPRVVEAIREVMDAPGVGPEKIAGIGVTTPGLIDQATGTVIKSVRLGWYHVPIRAILQNQFEPPVFIGKDTHTALLGEQWYGAGRKANNLIYVWVGTGIAIGILLDGRIYTGSTGMAGEFGHISIEYDGVRCKCGNEGCLESLAGLEAMVAKAGEALSSGRKSSIQEYRGAPGVGGSGEVSPQSGGVGFRVDPIAVLEAAAAGDALACEIVENAGRYLGVGIASLINIFNPECIIIGGQIRAKDEGFMAALSKVAKERALAEVANTVTITASQFGQDAGLVGATALVWREVFSL